MVAVAAAMPPPPPLPSPHDALVGLVAQLADTSDPRQVSALLSGYAERGRRLTLVAADRGPPAG